MTHQQKVTRLAGHSLVLQDDQVSCIMAYMTIFTLSPITQNHHQLLAEP